MDQTNSGSSGSTGSGDNWDIDVDIPKVEGIEQEGITNTKTGKPPKSVTVALGGIFSTIAAIRGKDFWKLSKGECNVLKANEKSISDIIPASVLSKLGIISFAAVLINATLKRAWRDLKEIRDDSDDEYYEEDEVDEIEHKEPKGRISF